MKKLEAFAANADITRESIGIGVRGTPVAGTSQGLPANLVGRERARNVWMIDVDRIIPDPDQPRKDIDHDAIAKLAESLKTRGQLQPVQVRWDEGAGRFVVIMGERRWRAAQLAGLPKLACVVREGEMDDDERLAIQLIENCLREDLTPIDQAKAFRKLVDAKGWSHERLASELAITQATVSRSLSLLTLPETVQEDIGQGSLSQATAFEIAKLDDPREQIKLARTAVEQGLTRDDVAKQVRRPSKKKATAKKLPAARVWRIDGTRVEVSRKAGVDYAAAVAALEGALAKLHAEHEADDLAAA